MDSHWRYTQKPARFFMLDARAFAAIMLFIVHISLWTFLIAIFTMFVFWLFERRGLTFEAALRAMRSWFVGRRRPAMVRGKRRHWVDFG